MSDPHLDLSLDPRGVATLMLRRPAARNALTPGMVVGIPALLREAAALPAEQCRVLVLRGEGRVFCAGADIRAMLESGRADEAKNRRDARRLAVLFRSVAGFPAPVIAAVQGAALGGGFGLSVASDLVLAEESARFGTPEARLGLVPAVISPYVVRRLGPGAAGPFLLGGLIATGREAREAGAVHRLVPPGSLDFALGELLPTFLECAPEAVRRAKELLLLSAPLPKPEIEERTIAAIAAARASKEGQAGTAAFLAKAKPPWAPTATARTGSAGLETGTRRHARLPDRPERRRRPILPTTDRDRE